MNKLRCLAIDDEPFALEILADDIAKMPFLELVGTFTNPLEATTILQQEVIDLLFLDIQMPALTGMQFLRTLRNPPMVIMTTAYEQYALESYELAVVDYLLKPIPFERFFMAVNKALDLHELRRQALALQQPATQPAVPQPAPEPELVQPEVEGGDSFFIFSEYREIKIYYHEVLYIEGLKDYVKIFTTQQPRPYLSRMNLKTMDSRLPDRLFCRVHRSFIVALDKITSFQRARLFVGKQEIPIGNIYAELFLERYKGNSNNPNK